MQRHSYFHPSYMVISMSKTHISTYRTPLVQLFLGETLSNVKVGIFCYRRKHILSFTYDCSKAQSSAHIDPLPSSKLFLICSNIFFKLAKFVISFSLGYLVPCLFRDQNSNGLHSVKEFIHQRRSNRGRGTSFHFFYEIIKVILK